MMIITNTVTLLFAQETIPLGTNLNDALKSLSFPSPKEEGTKFGFTALNVVPWSDNNYYCYTKNFRSGSYTKIFDFNNNDIIDKDDRREKRNWSVYIDPSSVGGDIYGLSQADTPFNINSGIKREFLLRTKNPAYIPTYNVPLSIGDEGYAETWNGRLIEKSGNMVGLSYNAIIRRGALLLRAGVSISLICSYSEYGYDGRWSKTTGRYVLNEIPADKKIWYEGADEMVNAVNSTYDKMPTVLKDMASKIITQWDSYANRRMGPNIGFQGLFPSPEMINLTISPTLLPKGLLMFPCDQPGIDRLKGSYYVENPADSHDYNHHRYEFVVSITPHNGGGTHEKLFENQIKAIHDADKLSVSYKDGSSEKIDISGADEAIRVLYRGNSSMYDEITLRCANATIKVKGYKDDSKVKEKLPYTLPLARLVLARLLDKEPGDLSVIDNSIEEMKRYRWAMAKLAFINMNEATGAKFYTEKNINYLDIGVNSPEQIIDKPSFENNTTLKFKYEKGKYEGHVIRGTGSCQFSANGKTIQQVTFDEYDISIKDSIEYINTRWQVVITNPTTPMPVGGETMRGKGEKITVSLQEYKSPLSAHGELIKLQKITSITYNGTARTAYVEISKKE